VPVFDPQAAQPATGAAATVLNGDRFFAPKVTELEAGSI
jgi:hypothetical protein